MPMHQPDEMPMRRPEILRQQRELLMQQQEQPMQKPWRGKAELGFDKKTSGRLRNRPEAKQTNDDQKPYYFKLKMKRKMEIENGMNEIEMIGDENRHTKTASIISNLYPLLQTDILNLEEVKCGFQSRSGRHLEHSSRAAESSHHGRHLALAGH